MSKRNDDFFEIKKPWSAVKDELLSYYLEPYTQKILYTRKPLVYVDCFAGKGKFDDGSKGSPLIALEIIEKCKAKSTVCSPNVSSYFIDLNYGIDLQSNLANYNNVTVVPGKYEDEILTILKSKCGCNIFLYIDPYGIKALQSSLFEKYTKSNFGTIELLINLNSFGFIREACRVIGFDFLETDKQFFDDLLEYDPTILDQSINSKTQLNEIAGGDYWIEIAKDYRAKLYDGYEAEKRFAALYCEHLSQHYKYVLNMPLRIQQGQHPKYRMVHATNHVDGCLLMVDNICDKWQILQKIQGGQGTLWEEDQDSQIVDDKRIKECLLEHISSYTEIKAANDFLADFFVKYGVFCSVGSVKQVVLDLEKHNEVEIIRDPKYTKTGKESRFLDFDSDKKAWIRCKP